MSKAKARLREKMLKVRRDLSAPERFQQSKAMARRFLALPEYIKAQTVLFYWSIRQEISVFSILEHAWQTGKIVLFPRVEPKTKTLSVYHVKYLTDLQIGSYNILEPNPAKTERGNLQQIDLVLVPGIAFNRQGFRLGYGGGYYDRFLSTIEALRVGVLYREQWVEQAFQEEHDVRMDILVSPDEVVRL